MKKFALFALLFSFVVPSMALAYGGAELRNLSSNTRYIERSPDLQHMRDRKRGHKYRRTENLNPTPWQSSEYKIQWNGGKTAGGEDINFPAAKEYGYGHYKNRLRDAYLRRIYVDRAFRRPRIRVNESRVRYQPHSGNRRGALDGDRSGRGKLFRLLGQ